MGTGGRSSRCRCVGGRRGLEVSSRGCTADDLRLVQQAQDPDRSAAALAPMALLPADATDAIPAFATSVPVSASDCYGLLKDVDSVFRCKGIKSMPVTLLYMHDIR